MLNSEDSFSKKNYKPHLFCRECLKTRSFYAILILFLLKEFLWFGVVSGKMQKMKFMGMGDYLCGFKLSHILIDPNISTLSYHKGSKGEIEQGTFFATGGLHTDRGVDRGWWSVGGWGSGLLWKGGGPFSWRFLVAGGPPHKSSPFVGCDHKQKPSPPRLPLNICRQVAHPLHSAVGGNHLQTLALLEALLGAWLSHHVPCQENPRPVHSVGGCQIHVHWIPFRLTRTWLHFFGPWHCPCIPHASPNAPK